MTGLDKLLTISVYVIDGTNRKEKRRRIASGFLHHGLLLPSLHLMIKSKKKEKSFIFISFVTPHDKVQKKEK